MFYVFAVAESGTWEFDQGGKVKAGP